MKPLLVYTFTCASCSSTYIGKTCCHFKTRIDEHIKKDSKSHIFKHLHSTATCCNSCNSLSFKIIEKANLKFDLRIKEPLHINWRKPNLRVKATFKIWIFYFSQILTGNVEKQHVSTPSNFIFKFSHSLTLFPIFSAHENWIVFYVAAHLFNFYYQQVLRSNEEWTCSNNYVCNWKMAINETGDYTKAAGHRRSSK